MEKIKLHEGLKRNYIIPCFQREYSWGEEEIEELIKNIKNIKENEEYCLGIITVKKTNEGTRILIDGQQRLTTLYMIAIKCNYITKCEEIQLCSEYNNLLSETDKNSLKQLVLNKINELPQNFKDGWKIINKNINKENKEYIKKMIAKNLYYYEVYLDENTNVNHYFEVMNSRGVQLSRSDIVKSLLMNNLKNDYDKSRLNYLWYKLEQMNNKIENIPNFHELNPKENIKYKTINDILKQGIINNSKKDVKKNNDDDDNSILNFEYFLLYAIRLYVNKDIIGYEPSGEFNLNDLIKEYEDTFTNKKNEQIIDFLDFLIKIKKIYDKYIVEFDNSSKTWKLGIKNNDMLLIQSCLRVSFVNRRLMHWIYITLDFFYKNKDINEYISLIKQYIRKKYVNDFIARNKTKNYRTGFDTPIVVLNYLDYLLKIEYKTVIEEIPESKGIQFDSFTFKFRNSIEHFMPRHDSESGEQNKEWVDDFGNLALLSYGTNTKMQNASPDEKANHFYKDLSGYSLKLQIMSKIANTRIWNEKESKYITEKCINILEEDLKYLYNT